MIDSSFNPAGGEHRVLVVCADPASSDHLRSVLETQGFRVDMASRIEDARQQITALSPSVVLADIPHAPEVRSLEDCGQLVIQAVTTGSAVVVLAEVGQFGAALELLEKGAVDCVTKPLSADELVRRITIVLLKQKVERRSEAGNCPQGRRGPRMAVVARRNVAPTESRSWAYPPT